MQEWIGEIVLTIFIAGREYQNYRAKNNKVDTHDDKISAFGASLDKIAAKVNLVESESNSHKENIHKLSSTLNVFMSTTNQRFEKIDKNQSIQLMLLSQLCEKQGINTEMAKFLMEEK